MWTLQGLHKYISFFYKPHWNTKKKIYISVKSHPVICDTTKLSVSDYNKKTYLYLTEDFFKCHQQIKKLKSG